MTFIRAKHPKKNYFILKTEALLAAEAEASHLACFVACRSCPWQSSWWSNDPLSSSHSLSPFPSVVVAISFRRQPPQIYAFWTTAYMTESWSQWFFLAEISIRSPRKLFIFIMENIFSGSKYPENTLFYLWKQRHCLEPALTTNGMHVRMLQDRVFLNRHGRKNGYLQGLSGLWTIHFSSKRIFEWAVEFL